MPGVNVRARGVSEYDRSFKWTDSEYREEARAPFAGKESMKMLRTNEPPLQHKRRINPYKDSNLFDENPDDKPNENMRSEILLGGKKNEKFGRSVAHVVKSKVRAPTYEDGNQAPDIVELRLPKEASRDMDDAYLPPTENFVANNNNNNNNASTPVPKFQLSEPPPPKRSQEPARRRKKAFKAVEGSVEKRRHGHHRKGQTRAPRRKEEHVDFATDAEENRARVTQSIDYRQSKNLPKNYAKQHRLGIRGAQRPPKANHLTEYGRQYEWRSADHQSPMLRAEDIIFRSHLDMPKDMKVSDSTEYRRQFKAFRYEPAPKAQARKAPAADDTEAIQEERVARAVDQALANRRRPTPPPPPRVVVEGETFGPGETLNPQRMSFPLGRQRNYLSEYNANFRNFVDDRSPAPAHLLAGPRTASDAKSRERSEVDSGDAAANGDRGMHNVWFKEIMDLRRRAEEYKLRARGTHFSREHAAQIIGAPTVTSSAPSPMRPVLIGGEETNQQDAADGDVTPRNETDEEASTPRVTRTSKASVGRHHLARTTPCQGGVILSAEADVRESDRTESSLVIGKPRGLSRSDNMALRLAGTGEQFTGLRLTEPTGGPFLTAGKPTADGDQLQATDSTWADPIPANRDVIYEGFGETYNVPADNVGNGGLAEVLEEIEDEDDDQVTSLSCASSDRRPATTSSVRSRSNRSSRSSSVVTPRLATPPMPPMPPSGPPVAPRDDDAMSTLESVRSFVSASSALAEETLERARRNQERSWPGRR